MYNKNGFLLSELIIVIGLFSLIISLTFPFYSFINRLIMRVEVELLAQVLHAQQLKAVSTGKEQSIFFNVADNSYSFDQEKHKFSSNIEFGVRPFTFGPPSSPLNIIKDPVSFRDKKMSFFPTGSFSNGVVYIYSPRYLQNMYALSSGVSLWGILHIYKDENKRWIRIT